MKSLGLESINNNESFDSDEQVKVDPISFRERNAMLDIIQEKKAKFKFKSIEILKSIFCCHSFFPRRILR